ncbi:FAD-dependent oxidoreductase, partial [Bacillus velezensis]
PLLADGYQAIYVSGGARVNGRALRTALLNAAQKLGAIHVRGNARLLHQGTRIIGVEADGTTYAAEAVIITAGAWAGELLRPLGIELLVT